MENIPTWLAVSVSLALGLLTVILTRIFVVPMLKRKIARLNTYRNPQTLSPPITNTNNSTNNINSNGACCPVQLTSIDSQGNFYINKDSIYIFVSLFHIKEGIYLNDLPIMVWFTDQNCFIIYIFCL